MSVRWLVNEGTGCVDPSDRGLAYGDGLFETMAAREGRVLRLAHHFERLADGCRRLNIPLPDLDGIANAIAAQIADGPPCVVKLIVTRGAGSRGYRPSAAAIPTRILGFFPWPERPAAHYTHGIVVRSCATTLGENERLAGLKHLCRLEQVLAQSEFDADTVDEGVQRRASGQVIGGTSSNLFIVRAGRVATPRLDRCGVRGVMRRAVLETCERLGLPGIETDMFIDDLYRADELFLTNAIAGIRPVRELDGRPFAVGATTRRLMRAIAEAGDA